MANVTSIVMFDSVARKHLALAAGDVIAGSKLQLSTDVGNAVTLGTDGGLKVSATASLADDQILTGDNSGTVAVTLTPSANATVPTQTDYLIKADLKLAPVQPAGANQATVVGGAIYVPPAASTGAIAAPTGDDGTLPTVVFTNGGIVATKLLGDPAGWATISIGGAPKRIPYWD